MEALKAQAVCARTYAYRQIKANAYSQYGAHVDDSTNYQVYNNTASSERTDTAVMETYGQMVFYGIILRKPIIFHLLRPYNRRNYLGSRSERSSLSEGSVPDRWQNCDEGTER